MLQIGIQSGKAWTGLGLEEGLERKKKRMQDAILGFRSIHLVPSGRAQKSVHEKGNTGTGLKANNVKFQELFKSFWASFDARPWLARPRRRVVQFTPRY